MLPVGYQCPNKLLLDLIQPPSWYHWLATLAGNISFHSSMEGCCSRGLNVWFSLQSSSTGAIVVYSHLKCENGSRVVVAWVNTKDHQKDGNGCVLGGFMGRWNSVMGLEIVPIEDEAIMASLHVWDICCRVSIYVVIRPGQQPSKIPMQYIRPRRAHNDLMTARDRGKKLEAPFVYRMD